MAWISLTAALVKNRFSGAEFTGVTAAALASGQVAADVVAAQISAVVRMVRGRVAACEQNTLGEGETLPDELEDAALAMIVYRILTRLPNLKSLLDQNRVDANKAAESLMKDVARCELKIEQPLVVSDQVLASEIIETVTSTTRQASRTTLAGL